MTTILLLLIIIIFIIIIVTIISKFLKLINNNNNNNNNKPMNKNTLVLYEGKKLYYYAKKKLSFNTNTNTKKLDCNSNVTECKTDNDCKTKCLHFEYHKNMCVSGLCKYVKRNSRNLCQNGGQITSTFMFGRLITACICPENYIGLYCQIPNEMNSSYSRTFNLLY